VLVALTGFMRLDNRLGHVVLSSAVAILLGLLYLVYWLDHPFGTDIGVTPEPFRQSLEVFDVVDRGRS
jgi:hypothetical protein